MNSGAFADHLAPQTTSTLPPVTAPARYFFSSLYLVLFCSMRERGHSLSCHVCPLWGGLRRHCLGPQVWLDRLGLGLAMSTSSITLLHSLSLFLLLLAETEVEGDKPMSDWVGAADRIRPTGLDPFRLKDEHKAACRTFMRV